MNRILWCFLLVSLLGCSRITKERDFKLRLGKTEESWSLKELRRRFEVQTRKRKNPDYEDREITYKGFFLSDVLSLYGGAEKDPGVDEIAFECVDGYKPTMPFSMLARGDYILAFEEQGGGWQKLNKGKKKVSPGPFYVVGTQGSFEQFPWPYQVVGLELINFSKKYARLFPGGEPKDSVVRGFRIFKAKCLKCHAINQQGGDMGPELNVPKNITEYRTEKFLRRFIKNPALYRVNSPMPQSDLSTNELNDLLNYLKAISRYKRSKPL